MGVINLISIFMNYLPRAVWDFKNVFVYKTVQTSIASVYKYLELEQMSNSSAGFCPTADSLSLTKGGGD